jgi:hypothetical protein
MHLHSTLYIEHMDDDVMHYDSFMMIGDCLPFGASILMTSWGPLTMRHDLDEEVSPLTMLCTF